MANLRVVYDNALLRNSALTASTAAGSLVIGNVLLDTKAAVYRCATVSPTVHVSWTSPETISCVAIPFTNLTNAATIRVRGYTDTAGSTSAVFDSGTVVACPGGLRGDPLWSNMPQGVNSFAYGGGSYALVWLPRTSGIQHVQINIVDTGNVDGYVEFSGLVVGDYWEADNNCEWGAVSVSPQETTKFERSAAGDLRVDKGIQYRELSLKLDWLTANDKARLWRITRGNGMSTNVFLSVIPTSTDPNDVQVHMIYGKLSKQAAIQYQYLNQYASSLDIQEV